MIAPGSTPPEQQDECARLRAHAQFPEVARRTVAALDSGYREQFLLARLLNDRARITLAMLMLDMHFEPADAPGLTAGRLKDEAVRLGLCSPGRVAAVLALCRLRRLVEPALDSDRRRRRLNVTDRLLNLHRDRWRVTLTALAALAPEGAIGLARLEERAFLAPYVAVLLRPFRRGWRLVHDVPALESFIERDGGLAIAFALFEAAHTGEALTAAHLARAYGLSRSHVADILVKAAAAGLVTRCDSAPLGRSGGQMATPALVEGIESFVAMVLAVQVIAVREAMAFSGDAQPARLEQPDANAAE
ncbi:hypothetical protein [Ancylobacter amanitiformis]|uniref:MarR family transcriptional regulator n=1 Tax=Ancylobacter amanitiformis TaxID=217069 RepID=A0ABU0LPP9_9HYPH|nr:hypothetical protein [Ancylobacter amanitiformis]MDQ0510680.1 hypothetical protein [Ancylobacter amanitiformis]